MDEPAVHVLVVDDSAVVRQVMTGILSREAGMSVDVAADPLIAMEKLRRRRADVILLDLEMPRMDGLTFLRKLMVEDPIPVVICSGLTDSGTEAAIRALEEGAVEIVTKPQIGVAEFLTGSAELLVDAVRGAARARMAPRPPTARPRLSADAVLPPRASSATAATDQVVAVGASTGGTEALLVLLEAMPEDAPAIVIVQHMPEPFTKPFAERLDRLCRMRVKHAEDGDRVLQGTALVAPGNRHTLLRRRKEHYAVSVVDGPLVSRHRPSVNVLFRSVAQAAGPNALGVILTGMGDDGADGLFEMRRAGARTIAQDEATCVVFGMPREAILRGAVEQVLPLGSIAGAVLEARRGSHHAAQP